MGRCSSNGFVLCRENCGAGTWVVNLGQTCAKMESQINQHRALELFWTPLGAPRAPTGDPRAPNMASGMQFGASTGCQNEAEIPKKHVQTHMQISGGVWADLGSQKCSKWGALGKPKVIPAQLWTSFGLEKGDNEFDW